MTKGLKVGVGCLAILVIGIIISVIGGSNNQNSQQSSNVSEVSEPSFTLTELKIKIGQLTSDENQANLAGSYESPDQEQMKDPERIVTDYKDGDTVTVEGDFVEVVASYTGPPLKKEGFLSTPSRFSATGPRHVSESSVTHAGGGSSWVIRDGKAKVTFLPLSYVNYLDDGEVVLTLRLESEKGQIFEKKIKFFVDDHVRREKYRQ